MYFKTAYIKRSLSEFNKSIEYTWTKFRELDVNYEYN